MARAALTDDEQRRVREVIVLGREVSFKDTEQLDFELEQARLVAEVEVKLRLWKSKGAHFVYFGVAPIPLAIELGAQVGDLHPFDVYQQHHVAKTWAWQGGLPLEVLEPDLSVVPRTRADGDVIVRVTTWHSIDPVLTTLSVGRDPLAEVDLRIRQPGPDALCSCADVLAVAEAFRNVLDGLRDRLPKADIHVFAGVPAGLAAALGTKISPTKHGRVHVYQYTNGRTPPHRFAFTVGTRATQSPTELTASQLSEAGDERAMWRGVLADLKSWDVSPHLPADAFLESVDAVRPCLWPTIPRLVRAKAPLEAELNDVEPVEEFVFDHDALAWSIHSRLLLGIKKRVQDERERRMAARLFFLHEAMHVGIHTLTAPRSRDVGMLPRVLEQLDYEADAWAILHELSRVSGDRRLAALKLVDIVLSTFWAFDDGSEPIRRLQVRRLNRYLIWAWQRIRLARERNESAVARVLMTKPVLELSGLNMHLEGHRLFATLAPIDASQIEIGLATEAGFGRFARGAVCPLDDLLAGLRERDSGMILRCLGAVYDAHERGASNA
jgi:hypothetical protein